MYTHFPCVSSGLYSTGFSQMETILCFVQWLTHTFLHAADEHTHKSKIHSPATVGSSQNDSKGVVALSWFAVWAKHQQHRKRYGSSAPSESFPTVDIIKKRLQVRLNSKERHQSSCSSWSRLPPAPIREASPSNIMESAQREDWRHTDMAPTSCYSIIQCLAGILKVHWLKLSCDPCNCMFTACRQHSEVVMEPHSASYLPFDAHKYTHIHTPIQPLKAS